jgi:hypothetical protein
VLRLIRNHVDLSSPSDTQAMPPMRLAAARELIRRACAIVALLGLVLHIPLSGPSATANALDRPHQHAQAAHVHAHGGPPAEPAGHHDSRQHGMGCCVLCSALGVVVGPPPSRYLVERIPAAVSRVTFVEIAAASGPTRSAFLPVGARAPPRLI